MADAPNCEMVTPDDVMVILVTLAADGVTPAMEQFLDRVDLGGGELSPDGSLWGLWLVASSLRALAGDGESLTPTDGVWALEVLDADGELLDVDRQDPRNVLLGRWLAAVMSQDADQAAALWWAAGQDRCAQLLVDVFAVIRSAMTALLQEATDA